MLGSPQWHGMSWSYIPQYAALKRYAEDVAVCLTMCLSDQMAVCSRAATRHAICSGERLFVWLSIGLAETCTYTYTLNSLAERLSDYCVI